MNANVDLQDILTVMINMPWDTKKKDEKKEEQPDDTGTEVKDVNFKVPTLKAQPVTMGEFTFQFDLYDDIVIVIDADNYEEAKVKLRSLCEILDRYKLVIEDGTNGK